MWTAGFRPPSCSAARRPRERGARLPSETTEVGVSAHEERSPFDAESSPASSCRPTRGSCATHSHIQVRRAHRRAAVERHGVAVRVARRRERRREPTLWTRQAGSGGSCSAHRQDAVCFLALPVPRRLVIRVRLGVR